LSLTNPLIQGRPLSLPVIVVLMVPDLGDADIICSGGDLRFAALQEGAADAEPGCQERHVHRAVVTGQRLALLPVVGQQSQQCVLRGRAGLDQGVLRVVFGRPGVAGREDIGCEVVDEPQ